MFLPLSLFMKQSLSLSAFDEILSASYAIPDKEIPAIFRSEMKSFGKPTSSTPTHATPLTPTPTVEVLINLLSSISTLLNHTLGALVADGKAKQPLIESISSLSKAALPSSVIL